MPPRLMRTAANSTSPCCTPLSPERGRAFDEALAGSPTQAASLAGVAGSGSSKSTASVGGLAHSGTRWVRIAVACTIVFLLYSSYSTHGGGGQERSEELTYSSWANKATEYEREHSNNSSGGVTGSDGDGDDLAAGVRAKTSLRCVCTSNELVLWGKGGCTLVGSGPGVAFAISPGEEPETFLVLLLESDPRFKESHSVATSCIKDITFVESKPRVVSVHQGSARALQRLFRATVSRPRSRECVALQKGRSEQGVPAAKITYLTDRWNVVSLYHVLIGNTGTFQMHTTHQAVLETLKGEDTTLAESPPHFRIPKNYGGAGPLKQTNGGNDAFYSLVFPGATFQHGTDSWPQMCTPYVALGIWSKFELYHLSTYIRPPVPKEINTAFQKFADAFLSETIRKFGEAPALLRGKGPEERGIAPLREQEGTQRLSPPILIENRKIMGYDTQQRARGIPPDLKEKLVAVSKEFLSEKKGLSVANGEQWSETQKFSSKRSTAEQFHSVRSRDIVIAGEGAFFALMLWAKPNSTWIVVYRHQRPWYAWKHTFFHETVVEALQTVRLIVYNVDDDRDPGSDALRAALDTPFVPGVVTLHVPVYKSVKGLFQVGLQVVFAAVALCVLWRGGNFCWTRKCAVARRGVV